MSTASPASRHAAARALPPGTGRGLAVASAAHFFNDAMGNVYPVLVPLLMGPLHLGLVFAAIISSAHRLTQNLLQPLFGGASDRGGRLSALLPAALAAGAVATGLLPFAASGWVLLALAMAGGVTGGAFHPPAMAWVRGLSGTRGGRGQAIFGMGGNLGRALSPLILAAVAVWAGTRAVTWLAAVALGVGLLYLAAARRWQAGKSAGKAAAVPAETPLARFQGRWAATAALLAMIAAFGTVSGAILILVPIAYRLQGQPVVLGAVVVSVMLLAGSFGNGLGGMLSDLMARERVAIVAALASTACLVAFVLTHGVLSLVFAGLTGWFSMSTNAMAVVMCQDLFPESVAMASGLASGLGSAGGTLIVALLSLVAGATSVTVALLVAGAIGLLAIPAVVAAGRWQPAR